MKIWPAVSLDVVARLFKSNPLIIVLASLSIVALFFWILVPLKPAFLIDRPALAPTTLLENHSRIPTNNWVQASPLTKEEFARFAIDIRKLNALALQRKKPGEKVSAIVFSGEDFSWIRFETNGIRSRVIGAQKDSNADWR